MDITMKKFIYYGLFLSEEDKKSLYKTIMDNAVNSTLFLDHCTVLHHSNSNDVIEEQLETLLKENKTHFEVTLVAIGKSDDACAFKIETSCPCNNKIPHITICTYNNNKPFKSNFIKDWTEITPIKLNLELKKITHIKKINMKKLTVDLQAKSRSELFLGCISLDNTSFLAGLDSDKKVIYILDPAGCGDMPLTGIEIKVNEELRPLIEDVDVDNLVVNANYFYFYKEFCTKTDIENVYDFDFDAFYKKVEENPGYKGAE